MDACTGWIKGRLNRQARWNWGSVGRNVDKLGKFVDKLWKAAKNQLTLWIGWVKDT